MSVFNAFVIQIKSEHVQATAFIAHSSNKFVLLAVTRQLYYKCKLLCRLMSCL